MIRSQKNGFFDDPLTKKRFFDDPLTKKTFFRWKKMSNKSRRKKSKKHPGQKKAGPEAPANPYKKPIQNSKQQRSRLRRSPHFWGCCFEF